MAKGLARVLDDDEDLYVAWARASKLGPDKLDLVNRLEAASRKPAYVSLVESGHALPRLAHAEEDDLASRMREVASRLTSPSPADAARAEASSVVSVPVSGRGRRSLGAGGRRASPRASSTAFSSTGGSSGRRHADSSPATSRRAR